jgi:hypothetical protein
VSNSKHQTFDIELQPPALPHSHRPIPIAGPGKLTLRDDGLLVSAAKATGSARKVLAIASILGLSALYMMVERSHGLLMTLLGACAIGAGWVVVDRALARRAEVGEPVEHFFAWKHVQKLVWEQASGCLIVLIKGGRPEGGVYVAVPKDSPIEAAIRARMN